MPGRQGQPRADMRNCYMTDEEVIRRDAAVALFQQIDDEHPDLPAIVWWAVVAIASFVAFCGGLYLGDK